MPTLAAATARLRQASCDLAAALIGLRADPWSWEGSYLRIIRSLLVRVRLAGCRFVLFVSRCCQLCLGILRNYVAWYHWLGQESGKTVLLHTIGTLRL